MPAYTMSGRQQTKDETLSPGPAAYDYARQTVGGPSYTMGGRTKDNTQNDVSG